MNTQEAIKNLRIEAGISQTELADRIHVSSVTISRWENGQSIPKSTVARKIIEAAKKLGVTENCLNNLEQTLGSVKRASVTARKYGFPKVDHLLFQVIDGSANAVYVIEADTWKLLYVNRRTAELAFGAYEDAIGKKCYEYMWNKNMPCENCPLLQLDGYQMTENIIYEYDGRYARVRGRKLKWNGKDICITYANEVTELVEKGTDVVPDNTIDS